MASRGFMIERTIKSWHQAIENISEEALAEVLADDVVFHSPVVHTPQEGKKRTSMYLESALSVLKNEAFVYKREVLDGMNAMLEFSTEIDGIIINGVDIIRCDERGKIVDFKVMIRPLQAINLVHKKVGEMLSLSK